MSNDVHKYVHHLQSRSLYDANEAIENFNIFLDKIEKERATLCEKIQSYTPELPVTEKTALLVSCAALIASEHRLRSRAHSHSHAKSQSDLCEKSIIKNTIRPDLLDAVQSPLSQIDPLTYTKTLVQSLFFHRAADHGYIRFDLILPDFVDLVVSSVANFYPPLLASEETLTKSIEFYTNLFSDLLQNPSRFSDRTRQLIDKKVVHKFESLWFLGSRSSLRALRNAHQKLLNKQIFLENIERDHKFPPSNKNKKRRIGFLAQGDSYGHGWLSVRRIVENLDPNICEPVLVTWVEDPSRADEGVETFIIKDWSRAVSDIRNLDLDVLFFCTSLDRSSHKKPMQLSLYRLARRHVTAFMNNTTTASPYMDTIITSASMDAPNLHNSLFFEQHIVTTKNLPFAFDPDHYFPQSQESITREDLGVPKDAKIITCGNSVQIKMNRAHAAFIAKFLAQHKNVFFVLMPSFGNDDTFLFELNQIFSSHKVGLHRVKIISPSSRERQYGILSIADLYIDFFPFSGANSLFDPLYMGVPALSLLTIRKMRCAQGAAILEDLGLDDFVANTLEELEEKAAQILFPSPKQNETALKWEAKRKELGPQKILSSTAFNGASAKELAQILTNLAM